MDEDPFVATRGYADWAPDPSESVDREHVSSTGFDLSFVDVRDATGELVGRVCVGRARRRRAGPDGD